MGNDETWTLAGSNILAADVLDRIRRAIAEGWIAGIHLFLGGGGSGDDVAFGNYDEFLSHVMNSRPGDLFMLWSIAEMRKRRLLLVDNHFDSSVSSEGHPLSLKDIDRVREYLIQEKHNEILSIASAGERRLTAIVTDLEGMKESRFLNAAGRSAVPGGSICILPLTLIDSSEFYLAKAKRPNFEGKVLIGGAY